MEGLRRAARVAPGCEYRRKTISRVLGVGRLRGGPAPASSQTLERGVFNHPFASRLGITVFFYARGVESLRRAIRATPGCKYGR